MRQPRINRIVVGVIVLVLLVVALLLSNSLRQSPRVVLPDPDSGAAQSGAASSSGPDGITEIQVTPETVQTVIATLARPQSYCRQIVCETIWSGGSYAMEVESAVSGRWSRTDTVLADGRTRHVIMNGTTTYIWYGSERSAVTAAAGDISPDQEQHLLTYEDVLSLPASSITQADYRAFSGVSCIYVETEVSGQTQRYWISVESGLLIAAEKLEGGETIYRMASLSLEETLPTAADFTLPDGTVLYTPE